MNSRGTLISHRITGDTLAISDSVAMTPTVQPAAAGTQRYRENRLPRPRRSEGHRPRGYSFQTGKCVFCGNDQIVVGVAR